MARSVTSRCVTCIRSRPKFENPVMAPLPKNRVQFSRPFTITGVDFAGPLLVQSGIRNCTKNLDSGICMLCNQSNSPRGSSWTHKRRIHGIIATIHVQTWEM